MIITLTGANTFRLQHELTRLSREFVLEAGDLALERIDGQEADLERIREAINSLPFLVNKKMVILRVPSANKQFTEVADKLLQTIPDTTELVIVEPKLDKRSSYYKYIKAQTDYREFNELDVNGLAAWLQREAKVAGGVISSNDARYLIDRVGADQQLLANELAKLLIYENAISKQTIELLTEPTPQSTIFQLLEAAFAGDSKRAMRLYAEQRALKVEGPQIVAMLAWQLHILAIIKVAGDRMPAAIAKDAKLSPYVVQKSASIASKLTLASLKQLIADLLDIDRSSKSSNLDVDEALQNYLLRLAYI